MSAIRATGFRNLTGRIPLCEPLAVLVGENNAGKSNVIDACRLLFAPEAGPRARRWITQDDFAHDAAGVRTTDEFELEAELRGLSDAERARMVTCLAPSLDVPDAARLRLRARLRPDGRVDTEWVGGDGDHPDLERWAREAITCTYLHPLRDAAADLRPGRENRLVGLLSSLAPEGHGDRAAIEQIVTEANAALDEVPAVRAAKARVQDRVSALTGDGSFTQRTDLVFADPQFDRIVAALRALAGWLHPLELGENGLGYNNLLYMAVLLSALAQSSDAALRVLLIEEPEAHLHPQLQDLLMRYLEVEGGPGTQVIVTSHSPNFASAARVERVTVLARSHPGDEVVGRTPAEFGLSARHLDHLRRFLDVTKAALLFARGVILVEGVAEQLLVPVLARRLGRPLSRSGVAVINVGGVAFQPFLELFGAERLPCRCSVISDGDPPNAPSPDELDGADPALSVVAEALQAQEADTVRVRLARRTLEWDLAAAANWETLLRALGEVKPKVAPRLAAEYEGASTEDRADAILDAVSNVKGRFAQELAGLLADDEVPLEMPDYLREAIEWVTEDQDGGGAGPAV